MNFLILILSIIIFMKTTSYGIYELKENNNRIGGITVVAIAIFALILPNVLVYFRGI